MVKNKSVLITTSALGMMGAKEGEWNSADRLDLLVTGRASYTFLKFIHCSFALALITISLILVLFSLSSHCCPSIDSAQKFLGFWSGSSIASASDNSRSTIARSTIVVWQSRLAGL